MKIFNVGALEILFVVLLALILLGPQKAYKLAGDLGRWLRKLVKSQFWRDLTRTTKEIEAFPQKIVDEMEIDETLKDLDRSSRDIEAELHQMRSVVHNEMDELEKDVKDQHHHPGNGREEEL